MYTYILIPDILRDSTETMQLRKMQLQGLRWESNSRPRKKIYTLAKYPYRIRLPLLIIQCKILFLIYPIYTFTGITTIHIYTRTRDTLSATAFMAQLTGRRTRFAGSRVRFSPKALELHFSQLVSVESLHTRKISLSFTFTMLKYTTIIIKSLKMKKKTNNRCLLVKNFMSR